MAAVSLHDIAMQKFQQYVDYMCVLSKDTPSMYHISLGVNSQIIEHDALGIMLHTERLKQFVINLTRINIMLEHIKKNT